MSDKDDSPAPKVELEGKSVEEILEQIDLFSGLPSIHLKRVADIGVETSYKRNQKMFEEGDAGKKFYLILEGAIRISRTVPGMGEEALAVLKAGNYFGEMSLIDDAPRSAGAIAHEKCKLF
ncbi:MAG: cyclic nucleotide-binding domain-containing protein, partial [Deltaproteobacteria bacterium]|nr:cyclic nucleotide-binding domain-containing protein [Deltaproteobacteria bacterium]